MAAGWFSNILELLYGPSFEERLDRAAGLIQRQFSPETNPDIRTFGTLLEYASPSAEVLPLAAAAVTPRTLRKLGILSENLPRAGRLPARIEDLVRDTQGFIEERLLPFSTRTPPLASDEIRAVESTIPELENRFTEIADIPVRIDPARIITAEGPPSQISLSGLMSFLQETLGTGTLLRSNPDVRGIALEASPVGMASFNVNTQRITFDPYKIGRETLILARQADPLFREAGLGAQTSLAHELGHAAERGLLGKEFVESRMRGDLPPNPDYLFAQEWGDLIADALRLPYATTRRFSEAEIQEVLKNRQELEDLGIDLYARGLNAYRSVIAGDATPDLRKFFEHVQKVGIGATPRGYFYSSAAEIPSELAAGAAAGVRQGQPEMRDRWLKILAERYGWVSGDTLRRYLE